MRDGDALDNNPEITRSALEAIHSQVFGWALSRCNYDHHAAEDLMQQAYVELLSGNARFRQESSLKTFVFAVVQNLARGRYRRIATRLRLVRQHAHEAEVSYTPTDAAVGGGEKRYPSSGRSMCEYRVRGFMGGDNISLVVCK